jgi:hypothetical protein
MREMCIRPSIAVLFALLCPIPSAASVIVIDFDQDASGNPIVAGQILDDEYAALGVHISVDNFSRTVDLGVAFDTNRFTGGDDDLSHPFTVGNATSSNYGMALILQENGSDTDGDGIVNAAPDDEGRRPAGEFYFDLDFVTDFVAFALLDIEDVGEFNGVGFFQAFLNGTEVAKVTWKSLDLAELATFGDHSANSVIVNLPGPANELVFNFGGSGALGELQIEREAPEPGLLLGMGLTLLGLASSSRKRARPGS